MTKTVATGRIEIEFFLREMLEKETWIKNIVIVVISVSRIINFNLIEKATGAVESSLGVLNRNEFLVVIKVDESLQQQMESTKLIESV